jgi:hypothetical protein
MNSIFPNIYGRWAQPTLLLLLAGCGAGDPALPPLFPAEGRVTLGGQPVADALVRLRSDPPDTNLTITAPTDAQGRFQLSTFSAKASIRKNGVPAGSYRATMDLPMRPDQSGGGSIEWKTPLVIRANETNRFELEVGK